jgi:hypothetical protein
MADEADRYPDIITYEELAHEWLVLASRLAAREVEPIAPREPVCTWRNIRSWFRILESLGQTARLK